jgi:Pyruvate/2-oxoacid:ferredoxin oxidoreductase delta subunit
MALRNIVIIDEEKCNGCGQCVTACAEGAIEIVDGKARLISEIYCDGLGACLGHCPEDAITVEQREAAEFDEKATKEHLARQKQEKAQVSFQCPGIAAQQMEPEKEGGERQVAEVRSQLTHWPVQLSLLSPNAPCFNDTDLLLVADCVPFAMGDFHSRLFKDHSVAVGCPKLDNVDFYIEKISAILKANKLKGLTVVHMEVPCCSGLTRIARESIAQSGVKMPFVDITVSVEGKVIKNEMIEV